MANTDFPKLVYLTQEPDGDGDPILLTWSNEKASEVDGDIVAIYERKAIRTLSLTSELI